MQEAAKCVPNRHQPKPGNAVGGRVIRSSLSDRFRFALRLAPTRAHPPIHPSPCHYISPGPPPRASVHRAVACWWGGPPKCSGTGLLGGRGGPLWVPGPSRRPGHFSFVSALTYSPICLFFLNGFRCDDILRPGNQVNSRFLSFISIP